MTNPHFPAPPDALDADFIEEAAKCHPLFAIRSADESK
jgi:hypothetical protein